MSESLLTVTTTLDITADVTGSKQGENYRLYINNVLMTERTFKWEVGEQLITEHMSITVPPGEYSIYVTPSSFFKLSNVRINGSESTSTFKID